MSKRIDDLLSTSEDVSNMLTKLRDRYPEDSEIKGSYGEFQVILDGLEKLNDEFFKNGQMSLSDQGEYFIKNFDKLFKDAKYIESVKKWAKKIDDLVPNYKYHFNIENWDTSFPKGLLNAIIETNSEIHLLSPEENEMLKILEKIDKNASKNKPLLVNDKDDYFKNTTWLYENGFLNGTNNKADDDEYYMFFLTSVTEKGKTALKNKFVY